MNKIPNSKPDTSRTQPVVDALLKGAAGGRATNRNALEDINLRRPGGRRGSSARTGAYDFGTTYSVPAEVVGGKIKRLDGKPYKG